MMADDASQYCVLEEEKELSQVMLGLYRATRCRNAWFFDSRCSPTLRCGWAAAKVNTSRGCPSNRQVGSCRMVQGITWGQPWTATEKRGLC